jgi:hypothetical protein
MPSAPAGQQASVSRRGVLPVAGASSAPRRAPFRDTRLGRLVVPCFRFCASLKLAISLLSLFTLCLAVATFLESGYNARVAQDVIYHTWWFTALLFMLAVNILCAALKKYPWKRHQTGFLITHLGLITLVFGGLLTNLAGVEGQMTLIDSDSPQVQQAFRLANRSDTIQLVNQHQIEIVRERGKAEMRDQLRSALQNGLEIPDALTSKMRGHHWSLSFRPGSFAWHKDEYLDEKLPWGLRALAALADPLPGFSRRLDDNTKIVVENYYPNTERWPFAPVEESDNSFPALRLKLTTPLVPQPMKRWVTSLPDFGGDALPLAFEMFTLLDPALLKEFLNPPDLKRLGDKGQLVLAVGTPRRVCRIDLNQVKENTSIDLEGTGLKFTLRKRDDLMVILNHRPDVPNEKSPSYPALLFDLTGKDGTGTYLSCARLPHMRSFRDGKDVSPVTCWYHYPDYRWGQKTRMGCAQFLKAPGGKLYFRVYGKDGLRQAGKELDGSDTETEHELGLKPMQMKFQVMNWLPAAQQREHVVPRFVRPGSEPSERFEPALRCTLHCNGEAKEFWVRMSRAVTQVEAGEETFYVRYRTDAKRLDFDLTLQNGRQISDPGSNRPAAFESDVVLRANGADKGEPEKHTISMNNTLDHAGYKVYQTNYRPMSNPQSGELFLDSQGKLVSLSGFTVADDPGLFCKYLGSALLVLGIATMFYMRAYFFKRPAAA